MTDVEQNRSVRDGREAFLSIAGPEIRRQFDLLVTMFRQAGEVRDGIKQVRGPFHAAFNDLLADFHGRIKDLHPDFDLSFLVPSGYRSLHVRETIDYIQKDDIDKIRELLGLQQIYHLELAKLSSDVTAPVIRAQSIPPDVLDEAPYCKQGDEYYLNTAAACLNAGFRMVFAGVNGVRLNERAVFEATHQVHSTPTVTFEDYLNSFRTDAYRGEYGDNARVVSFTGADLDLIGNTASRVKAVKQDAKVFCLVVLNTERATTDNGVWHANLLLRTDASKVVLHDPSTDLRHGQAYRTIAKDYFAKRWAMSHNRAYLVIAA